MVSQQPVGRAVIPAAVVFQTVRQVAVAAASDAGPAVHTLPAQHVRSCHGLPTAWCARQWTTLTEWMFRRAVWNPSDPACLSQVMPIITPAYPADNSAFNVSDANLKLMKEEIRLARASVRVACGYVCGYVCGCVCAAATKPCTAHRPCLSCAKSGSSPPSDHSRWGNGSHRRQTLSHEAPRP